MGRHQREKARSKRAAFIPPSKPSASALSTTPVRASAVALFNSPAATASSSSSSDPHHVDLLRVAFLEWLLPLKSLTSPHDLWDRFMQDWGAIPAHELPVQSSRPHTLFSNVRALRNSNNMGAMRKEVREGRAKLKRGAGGDHGGLKPHQTLLQWYLDGADGGQQEQVNGGEQLPVDSAQKGDDTIEETQAEQPTDIAAGGGSSNSGGAKRKRTTAASESVEGSASTDNEKRRRGANQQSDHPPSTPLTVNSNIWDALADG